MANALGGIASVLLITLVAGVIAYIGDRVGHQVGRKRLTLFGLRPKYTSTIVAVATGMLIALAVTLLALLASNQVRTAFFQLSAINTRIAQLQAQELAARNELEHTQNSKIVLPIGLPIPNVRPVTIRPSQPDAKLVPQLTALFEETVRALGRDFPPAQYPLKKYPRNAKESEVQTLIRQELTGIRTDVGAKEQTLDVPVLLIPVIGKNLFEGDTLSFAFSHYIDRKIITAGEVLSSVDIEGGSAPNVGIVQPLSAAASATAVSRGMPPGYAVQVGIDTSQLQAALIAAARVRGKFRLVAKSSIDIYPHSGGLLLDFALVPR